MSLARANHSLGSVSKIWIPVREGTGTFEKRNAGRYQKTYSENLLWMMNYLWLWILLKAQHCKDLICHRWRMSWSWIYSHKLRAFSGYAPLPSSSTFCITMGGSGGGFFWPGCRRRMDTPRRSSASKYSTTATVLTVSPVKPNGSSLLSPFNESKMYQTLLAKKRQSTRKWFSLEFFYVKFNWTLPKSSNITEKSTRNTFIMCPKHE